MLPKSYGYTITLPIPKDNPLIKVNKNKKPAKKPRVIASKSPLCYNPLNTSLINNTTTVVSHIVQSQENLKSIPPIVDDNMLLNKKQTINYDKIGVFYPTELHTTKDNGFENETNVETSTLNLENQDGTTNSGEVMDITPKYIIKSEVKTSRLPKSKSKSKTKTKQDSTLIDEIENDQVQEKNTKKRPRALKTRKISSDLAQPIADNITALNILTFDSAKEMTIAEGNMNYQHRQPPSNPEAYKLPIRELNLLGLNIIISGILECIEKDDMINYLKQCGASVKSSVSKKIHLGVLGRDCGSKKVDKLYEYNIPCINEEELYLFIASCLKNNTHD